jgi:hypothetical protein
MRRNLSTAPEGVNEKPGTAHYFLRMAKEPGGERTGDRPPFFESRDEVKAWREEKWWSVPGF